MRALIAIKKLLDITNDKKYQKYFSDGIDTLIKWLPLFDTGYWLRCDLNPKVLEVGFRFNNPYGETLTRLPIHKIVLRDPSTQKENVLTLGSLGDAEGNLRIAGNDWSQPDLIEGKSVRKLTSVSPASYQQQLDGNVYHAPETYFYFSMPTEWPNNLRSEWLELVVFYQDIEFANLALQIRSIAPGPAFQWMRDGDLLLTGSRRWREWRIPVRSSDLGFYCGKPHDDKHTEYLRKLSKWEPRLKLWFDLMNGYRNTLNGVTEHENEKEAAISWNHKFAIYSYVKTILLKRHILPRQTVLLSLLAVDDDGVVMQIRSSDKTKFLDDGGWDMESDAGSAVYQPYLIAEQALGPLNQWQLISEKYVRDNPYIRNKTQILTQERLHQYPLGSRKAYRYLIDHAEERTNDALLWYTNFDNSYNDVKVKAGWASAFVQAYVIKAFKAAINNKVVEPQANYPEILRKALNGYLVPVSENGLLLKTPYQLPFFQEFSNSSHSIINAHIVSLNAIEESLDDNPKIRDIYRDGIKTLKNHLYLYDTGYWLRYDLNPKKELLCQIDWVEGEESHLIESISVENPQTRERTFIAVNEDKSFKSYPYISGLEWSTVKGDKYKKGRSFLNGYKIHDQPVRKGAVHNVYFIMALPTRIFNDDFFIPTFKLRIKYKDVAEGRFQLKIKPINMNDHHNFIPFQESHLICNGDQKWKEATFLVHPKYLGWFVGPAYQEFHAQQLELLGKKNDDWFLQQQGEKHLYYLNVFKENQNKLDMPR